MPDERDLAESYNKYRNKFAERRESSTARVSVAPGREPATIKTETVATQKPEPAPAAAPDITTPGKEKEAKVDNVNASGDGAKASTAKPGTIELEMEKKIKIPVEDNPAFANFLNELEEASETGDPLSFDEWKDARDQFEAKQAEAGTTPAAQAPATPAPKPAPAGEEKPAEPAKAVEEEKKPVAASAVSKADAKQPATPVTEAPQAKTQAAQVSKTSETPGRESEPGKETPEQPVATPPQAREPGAEGVKKEAVAPMSDEDKMAAEKETALPASLKQARERQGSPTQASAGTATKAKPDISPAEAGPKVAPAEAGTAGIAQIAPAAPVNESRAPIGGGAGGVKAAEEPSNKVPDIGISPLSSVTLNVADALKKAELPSTDEEGGEPKQKPSQEPTEQQLKETGPHEPPKLPTQERALAGPGGEPPVAGPDASKVNKDQALDRAKQKWGEAGVHGGGASNLGAKPLANAPGTLPEQGNNTEPPTAGEGPSGGRIAASINGLRAKLQRDKERMNRILKTTENKNSHAKIAKLLRVVKPFLPGVYAKVNGVISPASNAIGEAKITALKARIVVLQSAKKVLQTAKLASCLIDASRTTVQWFLGTIQTIILPILILILSPFLILIMSAAYYMLDQGALTKTIATIIKEIDNIIKDLEAELVSEQKKMMARKRISQIDQAMSQVGGPSAGKAGGAEKGKSKLPGMPSPAEQGQGAETKGTGQKPLGGIAAAGAGGGMKAGSGAGATKMAA